MGTWNSRGLRGSTLEDMINHSNEVYREKKLAPSRLRSRPAISLWRISTRKVRWTISVRYRGFRCALTPRSVR